MEKLLKAILKEQQKQTKLLQTIISSSEQKERICKYYSQTTVDPHNHTEALENFRKY